MASPTFNHHRRKRDNGAIMPRLQKAVDESTGEVYHVETTRQAKRRYQRHGAQLKPTVGQINAADIWNKQEEKIRRDKEREEKRKKAKLRQDQKDTRLRELQLEKLRAGRISIEDTWGKVNASQNRLHRFFGPPESLDENDDVLRKAGREILKDDQPRVNPTVAGEITAQQNTPYEDLEEFFTNSPLSPSVVSKSGQSASLFETEATVLLQDKELDSMHRDQNSPKRAPPSASQAMMPPPKRPPPSRNITRDSRVHTILETGSAQAQKQSIPARPSLGEITGSQINKRTNERPNSLCETELSDKRYLIGTQAVKDVLSGLCSQDFADDFTEMEGKEKKSPSKPTHSNSIAVSTQRGDVAGVVQSLTEPQYETDGSNSDDVDKESDAEEFDDEGVDDESLLSLAATQQLRSDLFASSKRKREDESIPDNTELIATQSTLIDNPTEQNLSSSTGPRLCDSFAMENLDDDDLLQGLENYENEVTQLDNTGGLSEVLYHSPNYGKEVSVTPKKHGRVLPWIKNPISFSYQNQGDNELPTTSPLSPWDDR